MVTTPARLPMVALSAVLEHPVTEHVRLQQHLTRCDQPADPRGQSSSDSVSSRATPYVHPSPTAIDAYADPDRCARC